MAPPPTKSNNVLLLSKSWSVGPELGRGACGSVHAAVLTSQSTSRSSSSDGPIDVSDPSGLSYVVKLAPLPSSSSSTSSSTTKPKKKRRKSPAERNADLLYHENLLYRNVLNDLRGTVVPKVPHPGDGGPPAYGDVEGYRYLCMERMDRPLPDVIPLLVSASASSSSSSRSSRTSNTSMIDLGPIAQTLISHLRSVHRHRLLFVDVKVDNFMLCHEQGSCGSGSGGGGGGAKKRGGGGKKKKKKKRSMAEELAGRIRLIDLGLVESYRDVTGGVHREDMYPSAPLVGTPEYASLNVLSGHTVSRRDDLQAVGYVLSDLILRAVRYGDDDDEVPSSSSTSKKKSKGSTSSSNTGGGMFPWSNAQSDEEVLTIKRAEVEGSSGKKRAKKSSSSSSAGSCSGFFESMAANGNDDVEAVMREYFEAVQELDYTEKPDYDALMGIVSDLTVNVKSGGTKKKSSGSRSSAAAASATKRTPRKRASPEGRATRTSARGARANAEDDSDEDSDVEIVYDEDVPPTDSKPKRRKGRAAAAGTGARSSRRAAAAASYSDDDEDSDVIMVDVSDEEDYHTAAMDWDSIDAENKKPAPSSRRARTPPSASSASASSTTPGSADKGAIRVHVISGPMKGESFGLGGDCPETVTVGKAPPKPRNGSTNGSFKLGKDKEAANSHVKFALHSNRGSHSVRVTDLKADGGTLVNNKEIPSGKYKQAFIGDKVTIGGSIMQFKRA